MPFHQDARRFADESAVWIAARSEPVVRAWPSAVPAWQAYSSAISIALPVSALSLCANGSV